MEKLYLNVMEALFKMDYVEEMLEMAEAYSTDCWEQLENVQVRWCHNLTGDRMRPAFLAHCDRLSLPGEKCDLDAAVKKVQTVWKEELLVATADMIVREHYNLPISVTVVRFEDGKLQVNEDVIAEHEGTNDDRDMITL